MRRLATLMLALLTLIAAPAFAQVAKGEWEGTLEVAPGAKLRIAVHIAPGSDGKLQGTLDSIDQGAFGIPLADVSETGGKLSFSVPAVAGTYEGRWDDSAKAWKGGWSQGGASLPLVLRPGKPVLQAAAVSLPANWVLPNDAAIASLIDTRIANRPGEGIVIGVIDESGARIVARGPAGARAFDRDTLFEIGSMTKVFTSLLLADMVRRGEVSLDDPAAKYLPAGATMPKRGGKQITLRDLATHRSGLPRLPTNMPFGDMSNPYADYTEAMLIDFLRGYTLTRDIGSQYEYSNLGAGLLGYLLSQRVGMDYEVLVKQRILIPLGMHDTMIALGVSQKSRFAQGYDAAMQPVRAWDLPTLAGAGALRSTASDMLIFLAAASGLKPTPLAPAFALMLAERLPGPQQQVDTGLAWMVVKSPTGEIVFHDGGTAGFRTIMAFDPAKKRGVVVMTNAAAEPSSNDLALHLLIGLPPAPVTR